MTVRGAPAIAIVAALSLAVELQHLPHNYFSSTEEATSYIVNKLNYLEGSRPTAVNLFEATAKLRNLVQRPAHIPATVYEAYISAAEQMLIDDVNDNRAIGEHGAKWLISRNPSLPKFKVLTHCNTGSLATAGYGTALGVIRSLFAAGALEHAFCTETRPYNQGSRLTAYELVFENIPATLITDSMASALFKKEKGTLMAVIVGADRVARNGDTANKVGLRLKYANLQIGTYQLAISAQYHGIPFLVAAPTTSIDLNTLSGENITIEERAPHELITIRGPVVVKEMDIDVEDVRTVSIAAEGIGVWNAAFDVTPASLITAIVTEKGVIRKKEEESEYDLSKA